MKNNKGFTLIELLATILILAIVASLTIVSVLGIVENTKQRSYKTTISNIENTAKIYLKENSSDISFVDAPKGQHQCIQVKHLIDSGYFDNEILKSKVTNDKNVESDMYIYVSRDNKTKVVNNAKLIQDKNADDLKDMQKHCEEIAGDLDKNIIFSYQPPGWSNSKKVTIEYELKNITVDDQIESYTYSYTISTGGGKNATVFTNKNITEKVTINNPAQIFANISWKENGQTKTYSKSITIPQIDNDAPVIEPLSGDTQYANEKSIIVTIKENVKGSGFNPNDKSLEVKYGWSKSATTAPTIYQEGVLTYSDCPNNFECEKAQFEAFGAGYDGEYYLWVIPTMKDIAGNEVQSVISTGTYKFDSTEPTISYIAFYAKDRNLEYKQENWTKDHVHTELSSDDAGSGVKEIQYIEQKDYAEGKNWKVFKYGNNGILEKNGITYTGTESWELKTRDQKYFIRACDYAGNCTPEEHFAKWHIQYDLDAPSVPQIEKAYHENDGTPYTPGNWTNRYVETVITSADNHSGIKSIQYVEKAKYDNNIKEWKTFSFRNGDDITIEGNKYTGIEGWTVRNGRDDSYYFRACDDVGNCSETIKNQDVYTIRYDTEAPVAKLSGGDALKVASQSLTYECTDAGGSKMYQYSLSAGTDSYQSYKSSSNKKDLTKGTYTLKCKDNAGNVGNTSVTLINYHVQNLLETIKGTTGTYTNANYDKVVNSTGTYVIKNGANLTSTDLYTIPTGANASTFKGASTTYTTNAASLSDTHTVSANATYYMWFNRTTHTLTLDKGTCSSVTGSGTYKYGQEVIINATPGTGYLFDSWTKNSGNSPTSLTIANPKVTITGATELTANCIGITYTIEYNCNGNGTTAPPNQTITYGNTVTINGDGGSCSKKGYNFTNWGAPSDPTDTYNWTGWTGTWKYVNGEWGIDKNKLLLNAYYNTPKEYTVKYNCNGSGTAPSNQTIKYGNTIPINGDGGDCSKKGYNFTNWGAPSDPTDTYKWTGWTGPWKYDNGEYGISNNELNLTAQYTPKEYTIKYYCGANTTGKAPDSQTVKYGNTIPINGNGGSCYMKGHRFSKWNAPGDTNDESNWTGWTGQWNFDNGEYGIDNNELNLTAKYTLKTYTVRYDCKGYGNNPSDQKIVYNNKITIADAGKCTRTGYTHTRWCSPDGNCTWTTPSGSTGWTGTWSFDNNDYGIENDILVLTPEWTDKTVPSISITNNKNGVWTNADVEVTVNFSDEGSGIKANTLAYSTDGSTWTSLTNTSTSSYEHNWTSNTNTTVYYKICDNTGNCNTASTKIQIDKSTPKPTIILNDCSKLSYEVTDNTLAKVTGYYVSDNATKPTLSSDWVTTLNKTIDVNSNKTYYVWAKDEAGNISEVTSQSLVKVTRNQGAETTLTTKYNSTSSTTGTSFNSTIYVLPGNSCNIWASATVDNSNYELALKINGTSVSNPNSATTQVTTDTTIVSEVTGKTYTINYYLGNGTSVTGEVHLGSTTCQYNTSCQLTKWSDFKKIFPNTKNGWKFAGWTSNNQETTIKYTNNQTFKYNQDNNINLYAIGSRTFNFYSGNAPTDKISSQTQYWNPRKLELITSINVPQPTAISSWNFLGYRATNDATSTVILTSGNKTPSASDLTAFEFRSIYQRQLTLQYNGNGHTGGSTSNTTAIQYYNSGYAKSGVNQGDTLTTGSFTLANNGFTKDGYSFKNWNDGSNDYAEQASYTWKPAVNSTTITKTIKAIWNTNTAAITITKDGGAYTGKTVALYKNGTSKYTSPTTNNGVYTFSGVVNDTYNIYVDNKDTGKTITINKTGAATIKYFTLTIQSGTNISKTSSSGIYLENTSVNIEATPKSGYTFDKWTVVSGNTPTNTADSKTTISITQTTTLSPSAKDITKPSILSIEINSCNAFSYSASDSVGVAGYLINTTGTTPTASTSGWVTTLSKDIDITKNSTYYIWAKDAAGNISDRKSISLISISRNQGANSTLTTKYNSTSENNGTSFSNTIYVLPKCNIWAKATADNGHTVSLRKGTEEMTNPSHTTITSTTTISSIANNVDKPTIPTISVTDCDTFTYSSTDSNGIAGYYIATNSTKPTSTSTGWITSPSKDIDIATNSTYYVWAKDTAGNISDEAGTISLVSITRTEGTNTTLTTRYNSTSSTTGTSFNSNIYVLPSNKCTVYATATNNSGYHGTSLTINDNTPTSNPTAITSNTKIASSNAAANQITLKLKKDGSAWSNSGKTISLYQNGVNKYTQSTNSSGNYVFIKVIPGTYDIYIGGRATGLNVNVETTIIKNINYYTLTLNKETGISSVGPAGTYLSGDIVTITANVNTGYTFASWTKTSGNTPTSTTSATTTVTIKSKTVLTATATPNKYTVTFEGNKFSTETTDLMTINGLIFEYDPNTSYLTINGTPTQQTVHFSYIPTTFTAGEQYKFTYEYISGSLSGNCSVQLEVRDSNKKRLTTENTAGTSCPTSGKTASRILEILNTSFDTGRYLDSWFWFNSLSGVSFNNYKVKVTITKVESKEVTYNELYGDLPTPTRMNHTFTGWSDASSGSNIVNKDTIVTKPDNHTLYAQWRENVIDLKVTISGTTRVDQILTATPTSSLSNVTYTYQWYRSSGNNTNVNEINGATSSTYMLQEADLNKHIYVKVTAKKDNYTTKTVDSNVLGPIKKIYTYYSDFYLNNATSLNHISSATEINANSTHKYMRISCHTEELTSETGSCTITTPDIVTPINYRELGYGTSKTSTNITYQENISITLNKNNTGSSYYAIIESTDKTPPTLNINDFCVEIGENIDENYLKNKAEVLDESGHVLDVTPTSINTSTTGTHQVTYTATDNSPNKNKTEKKITVTVYKKIANSVPVVTSGDGLYKDTYDTNRYIYRGENPNNYLTFNGQTWRILSIESDGTYKIIYPGTDVSRAYHTTTSGVQTFSNVNLYTYLNDEYYSKLTENAKNVIVEHAFNSGQVVTSNDNKTHTILNILDFENNDTTTAKVGLQSLSDYLRISTNSECNDNTVINNLSGANKTSCKVSNWLYTEGYDFWTLNSASNSYTWFITDFGGIKSADYVTSIKYVRPVIYLSSSTTFTGEGTSTNPYVINDTCSNQSNYTCELNPNPGYDSTQTLTISVKDSNGNAVNTGIKYSFDNDTTFTSTNTKNVSSAGTYIAHIQDNNGLTNSCSVTLNSRKEWRSAICAVDITYSEWVTSGIRFVNDAKTCNPYTAELEKKECTGTFKAVGSCAGVPSIKYNEYFIDGDLDYNFNYCAGQCLAFQSSMASQCQSNGGGPIDCNCLAGEEHYTRTCSCDKWGAWSDWGTTELTKSCDTNVETRIAYGK